MSDEIGQLYEIRGCGLRSMLGMIDYWNANCVLLLIPGLSTERIA